MNNDADIRRVLVEHPKLYIALRHDYITLFRFQDLSRSTIELYVDYLRQMGPRIRPDARNLFDLRFAGMPSMYLLEMADRLYEGIPIPPTVKNALLISTVSIYSTMMRILLRRLTSVGESRVFIHETEAIAWLKENLPPSD